MAKQKRELPYTVGRWRDLPNYQCRECPFSAAGDDGEARVLDHYRARHLVVPPPSPTRLAIVDRFGQEVGTRVVGGEVDEEE